MRPDFAAAARGYFVACRSRELGERPRAVSFHGIPAVLFRDAAGRAGALLDRCPHRGVPLSAGRVVEGALACPYHGYRYDAQGACVVLPGLAPGARIPKGLCTPALEVAEQDGFVWLRSAALGEESAPPRLPWVDDPDYHTSVWQLEAPGTLLDGLENFLDATHTHYVHGGLIRRPRGRRLVEVEIRREGRVAEARYHQSQAAGSSGLISRLLARGIDGRFGRFIAPCVAQLEYRSGAQTMMVISALYTPRDAHALDVWAVVSTRRVSYVPSSLVQLVVRGLFAVAIRQDQRILGLQDAGRRSFGEAALAPSPTDVLRPHIESILRSGAAPAFSKRLTLAL